MKIRCDLCDQEDAMIFCSADEAALCDTCDRRVHSANKVAQRHHRFSLVHPVASSDSPLCDICQERRALLFCREDRAILCRECDYRIHTAKEQRRKHCRFLLTGAKLKPLSSMDQISCEVAEKRTGSCANRRRHVDQGMEGQTVMTTSFVEDVSSLSASGCSSISEYLETLPGWHVEEFFDNLHDLC